MLQMNGMDSVERFSCADPRNGDLVLDEADPSVSWNRNTLPSRGGDLTTACTLFEPQYVFFGILQD